MQSNITEPKSLTLQTSPCESCDSEDFIFVCGRGDRTRIVRCLNCDLEAVNPLPDKSNLKSAYDLEMKGDPLKASKNEPLFKTHITQHIERGKSFKKIHKKRLRLIERFSQKKGNLLDVGCGAGFFLNYAKLKGWNVNGIDLLDEYIQFANKKLMIKNAQCVSLEEAQFPEQYFDVVTLWDLIEHLSHPLQELKKINHLLKPGGHLAIWTPNVKNSIFMKERWTGYITYQHLYFFSLKTLRQLLKRAGFKIVFSKTSKTKKGLLIPKESLTFKEFKKPESTVGRIWFSVKRDFKNVFNPMTYMDPLFNMRGYGFNLLIIAEKDSNNN